MKSASIHIRIEPELRKALEKQAEEENRTLSNLIIDILKKYFNKQDLKKYFSEGK